MNPNVRTLLICVFLGLLFPSVNAGETVGIDQGRGVPQFLRKVTEEKKAHVVFLGGSITQNAKGHSAMVPAWLEKQYPDCDFTFTNAGLSSTCSVTGAFRLRSQVLAKGPIDLLVVEFAVNDDQDASHDRETAIRGLEGIIRAFRKTNPGGDIISVQFVNPSILEQYQKGEVAVSVQAHRDVASHYDLPIVDVGLALSDAIDKGTSDWKTYGGTHPGKEGYEFATNLITGVIEQSEVSNVDDWPLAEALDPENYENARFIDPQTAAWLGGWKFASPDRDLLPEGTLRSDYYPFKALRSDEAGSMIYIDFTGPMLGAFVLAGPDAGILEIKVGNDDWQKVDLFHRFSEKLHYPRSVILVDGLGIQRHQAAIRISKEKNPKSSGNGATILFFAQNY